MTQPTGAVGLFKATNGDVIQFSNLTLSGDTSKYFIWRYDPSTAHIDDAGWDGVSAGGYPSGSNTITPIASCASITTPDTFYVYGTYTTSTASYMVGMTVSYNITTKTASVTNGTVDIGGAANVSWSEPPNYTPRFAMFHDGTNVHLLLRTYNRGSSRYQDDGVWYYDGWTSYSATLYGWAGSTWGTAGLKASQNIQTAYSVDDFWRPTLVPQMFLGKSKSGNLIVSAGALYTAYNTTPFTYFYEMSLGTSSYSTLYYTTLQGRECSMYSASDGTLVVYNLVDQYKMERSEYGTSFGSPTAITLPLNPVGFIVDCHKSSTGPLRETIFSPATMYSVTYVYGTYTSYTFNLAVQTYNPSNGVVKIVSNSNAFANGAVPHFLKWATGSTDIYPSSLAETWLTNTAYTYPFTYFLAYYYPPITSFELNEQPTCIPLSPVNGTESFDQTVDTIRLSWKYSDLGDDSQTAYQVKVAENTSTATTYFSDGSGGTTLSETTVSTSNRYCDILPNVLGTSSYGYKWAARVRDSDMAWSNWASWNTFRVSGRPVASITFPANGTTVLGNYPQVVWTYTDPEQNDQSAYRIRVYDLDMSLLWEGDEVQTIGNVAHGDSCTGQIGYVLTDNETYTVGVTVSDSTGMKSSEALSTFTCSYSGGQTPDWEIEQNANSTVSVGFAVGGYSNSILSRWSERMQKYIPLQAFVGSTFTYIDISAPINGLYHYRVDAYRTDNVDTYISNDVATSGDDWVICSESSLLPCVITDMSFDISRGSQALEPLGRSKQVIGTAQTPFGAGGSVSIHLLDEERDGALYTLLKMAESGETAYIKSPWGEVFATVIGTPNTSWRTGGTAILTLSFVEVGDS